MITIGPALYNELPQSFGGAKPIHLQFYIDKDKLPDELLDPAKNKTDTLGCRTIPLILVFKTSEEYLVFPDQALNKRAWIIRADLVNAIHLKE